MTVEPARSGRGREKDNDDKEAERKKATNKMLLGLALIGFAIARTLIAYKNGGVTTGGFGFSTEGTDIINLVLIASGVVLYFAGRRNTRRRD